MTLVARRIREAALPALLCLLAVLSPGAAAAPASQVRNGLIVFVGSDPAGQPQIFTVCPDGSGLRQLTQSANGNSYPAWSRDGEKIAWSSNRTGASEIWIMNGDGSNQTQLTFEPGSGNAMPSWSSDGNHIAFTSVRTGRPEIWSMNADGGGQRQLTFTTTPVGGNAPNWSPNGSRIAFASGADGQPQLYLMNPDGSGVQRLTEAILPDFPSSSVPAWSPDGKQIAFWSGREDRYGQIWVINSDGSNRKPLTNCLAPANCANPAWSPDGTLILFETNRRGPVETWIMNADGSGQRPFLPFPYGAGRLPWRPDLPRVEALGTRRIVFMNPANGRPVPGPGALFEVAVVNLDGSGFRQITNDGTFKFLPHFSPDGTKIAYTKFSVGQYASPDAVMDIAVYDLARSKETVITRQGHNANATWSPDGSRIGYLNSAQPTTIWTVSVDGSSPLQVAAASGTDDDMFWGDLAWSRDDWFLFSVAQNINGCFKVRTDKIRPDGSQRTKVTDGGPNCTPPGMEQSGDADPGWSLDGKIIYSSRGFPTRPANGPPGTTERKLYSFSSDAWYPGKPEIDLSLPSEPDCSEGVPKASPDGEHVLLSRMCFDNPAAEGGIYLTDSAGRYRRFIIKGFGADWAPRLPVYGEVHNRPDARQPAN